MRTPEQIREQFLAQPRPFVWLLKLTEEEFDGLRATVGANHGDCPMTMIYVAEWYKRRYDTSSNIKDELPWFDAEATWRGCGFRGYEQYLAVSDRGKEWTYSMFVLGGMASRLECGHPDDKFLEQLCRLYHGEDLTLTAAGGRAIAMEQSIKNEGSIFYYIQEIIADRLPFAESDIENKDGDIAGLIRLIRHANRRALKEKFSSEWLINYADYYDTMSRRLRLGLKPERGNDGMRQYLSYERIESWGFTSPEKIARLKVSLRFKDGGRLVQDVDFEHPILTYSNSGNDENGFLAWNSKNAVISERIPNEYFDIVDVVVQVKRVDFSTEEKTVPANCNFPEFMQVYRMAGHRSEWSDRYRQAPTAVLYNNSCRIIAPPGVEVVKKPFYLYGEPDSEPYLWTDIEDCVVLQDSLGNEVKLYNRMGGYEIIFKKLPDTIAYDAIGKVTHRWRNSTDDDWQTEPLPLLFGKDGIVIKRHLTDGDEGVVVEPEELTFSSETEGVVEIRLTVGGMKKAIKVWYLPVSVDDIPIIRDFEKGEIRTFDGVVARPKGDELILNLVRGTQLNQIIIPVYSPREGREVWIDGEFCERLPLGSKVSVPFINAEHFTVKTIDKSGVTEITGEDMKNAYYDAPYQAGGDKLQKSTVECGNVLLYLFQPNPGQEFADTFGGGRLPVNKNFHSRHYAEPKFPLGTPFKPAPKVAPLDAFKAAMEGNAYFFSFKDLRISVGKGNIVKDLILPLIEADEMNETVISALWRLAFEFHFDWMLLPRTLWQTVPENLRPAVIELFLSSPKAINQHERRQLEAFADEYWTFNDYTTDNPMAKKALQLILGEYQFSPTSGHAEQRGFMREFDQSPVKYHEMTKIIKR